MENKKTSDVAILVLKRMYKARKLYLYTMGISFLLSLIIYKSVSKEYTSESSIAPEFENVSIGGLSSLASMAGVSLSNGNEGGDAIGPDMYETIAETDGFLIELLTDTVSFERDDQLITTSFRDYVENYTEYTWLESILSLPGKARNLLIKTIKGEKVESEESIDAYRLTEKQFSLLENLRKKIKVEIEKEISLIDVSVTLHDAEVAATINASVLQKIQNYIIDYRTCKIRSELEATIALKDAAQEKYLLSQKKYADYCDSHQNILFQQYKIEENMLENDMQLAYNAYSDLCMRVQQKQEKLQEKTPIFVVVRQPAVPLLHSNPRLGLTVVGWLLFAFFGTSFYVLFWEKLRESLSLIKGKS